MNAVDPIKDVQATFISIHGEGGNFRGSQPIGSHKIQYRVITDTMGITSINGK